MLSVSGQTPFEIVHLKTYTPGIIVLISESYCVGETISGTFGPLTSVQRPVPGLGLLPARVVDVALHNSCADPAFADGARGVMVSVA